MFCGNSVQVVPISHVIVHPGYDKKIYRHDIALVVLREDMKYTCTYEKLTFGIYECMSSIFQTLLLLSAETIIE